MGEPGALRWSSGRLPQPERVGLPAAGSLLPRAKLPMRGGPGHVRPRDQDNTVTRAHGRVFLTRR
jgi:hypothetical protein